MPSVYQYTRRHTPQDLTSHVCCTRLSYIETSDWRSLKQFKPVKYRVFLEANSCSVSQMNPLSTVVTSQMGRLFETQAEAKPVSGWKLLFQCLVT